MAIAVSMDGYREVLGAGEGSKEDKEVKVMKFIADFHIHSHYSVATSKQCDPENLCRWAAIKGLNLVGTGDFTHPAWREELKEKLTPAEEGLYR
mgnify:CR=1 FL=1